MDAIHSVNKLQVFYRDQRVGTISRTPDNTRCTFEYAPDWLANGFSISPLQLPLRSDLFIEEPTPF